MDLFVSRVVPRLAWGFALVVAASPALGRGEDCGSANGPDIFMAKLLGVVKWGTVGGTSAYSIGTLACNMGDEPLGWNGQTANHPVIAMNLYRLKNGRFEQIGMSWVKHGYGAQTASECCPCQNPGTNSLLGVGCSDVYSSQVNGNQSGGSAGGMGPRSEVNPYTGAFVYPFPSQGQTGDAIYKRLQVRNADLDPAQNTGAQYFGEAQFVSPDDSGAGNQYNNCAYAPFTVTGFSGGGWQLGFNSDSSRAGTPAIYAWQEADSQVQLHTIQAPNDGQLILGSRCTQNANGTWHYEYALYNMNSHRGAAAFSIPISSGVSLSGKGFHDVDYHSGEPYSSANWTDSLANGQLTWQTQSHGENPNANALRWGTLYNFRFNANVPPQQGSATIAFFRPGTPTKKSVTAVVPGGAGNASCSNAQSIPLGTTEFDNSGSTQNGPDLQCAGSVSHVVWFKHVSTFTGRLRISTCQNTNFNTVIAVYEDCACSDLNLLACNDQQCGDGSSVTVDVEAGRCYLIQVAGAGNASGSGSLKLISPDVNNAVRAHRILQGGSAGARFGFALSGAGHMSGENINDLVVGAFRDKQNGVDAGRAFFTHGTPITSLLSVAGQAGDGFGRAVGGGGDMNGDGVDDLVIGAPHCNDAGDNAGRVFVYSGANQSLLWTRVGQNAGDRFGWAVACAGDINQDGHADVLVAAPFNDAPGGDAGRVYVLNGQNGALLYSRRGKAAGDHFGTSVANIGDIDDDGVPDFIVGAPGSDGPGADAGRVDLISGRTKAVLQRIIGASAGDRFGSSVDGITYTLHGAKRTIIAVGAPNHDKGQVRVFHRDHTNPAGCGQFMCPRFSKFGQRAGDQFGASVALGQIAGNQTPDLLVGAPLADFNGSASGAIYMFDGGSAALLRRIVGEAAGDQFGRAVAVPGDLNGDGLADSLAGAPDNDAKANNAGRVYAFFSPQAAATSGAGVSTLAAGTSAAVHEDEFEVDDDETERNSLAIRAEDVNRDGLVNHDDLLSLLHTWGPCADDENCPADLGPSGGDGIVDVIDLTILINAW